MKARILTTATLFSAFAGPLLAVDPALLNLVMPDATVFAGVNVAQAKLSPFGNYVLTQVLPGDQGLQKLVAQTGFDPTRDVNEVLAVSNGGASASSQLMLASGIFNIATISAAAQAEGAVSEVYKGVTILESPEKTHGVAFLNPTVAAAGTVANVKAAIDRQSAPQPLPAAVAAQLKQLSAAEDAWALTNVPPSTLQHAAAATQNGATASAVPGLPLPPALEQTALQQIQSASGGVKFGANVAMTAQLQADNAQDATQLAGALQLLASLAQMQATQSPLAAALAKALTVSAQGATINVSLTLPEAQFQQLVQPKNAAGAARRAERK
jgi:hypothetical protein